MKKTLFFALLPALMFSACTTYVNFYQVAQTAPADEKTTINADGEYYYEDDNCVITYDLWADGGSMDFTVRNKSKEILYIDMPKCLTVKNGTSYNTFTLGGTVEKEYVSLKPEAQGIAPGSSRSFSGIGLAYERLQSCDWDCTPKAQHPVIRTYNLNETPATLASYVSYHVGENAREYLAVTQFYIRSVTNYRGTDIMKPVTETQTDCKGVKTNVLYHRYLYSPSTGFYVTYKEITKP